MIWIAHENQTKEEPGHSPYREREREKEGERDHLTEKEQLDISPKGRRVRPRHSTKQALRMSRLIMSITWGQAKKSVKQAFSFLEGKAVELA